MERIVILDGHTLNPGDLSWQPLEAFGDVEVFPRTPPDQLLARAKGATILLVNKVRLDQATIAALPQLRCICVTATGYNNVDLAAARERNIPVCNVVGYSTPSVAQHVFALLFALTHQIQAHDQSVKQGDWSAQPDFSYTLNRIPELASLTMGIYGLGRIGRAVAQIALAFGMRVIAHHKHPQRDQMEGVRFVALRELFQQANVVSLHAPLDATNRGIVNRDILQLLPAPAYLINTGRGGLVQEQDLLEALEQGTLTGAALDTLTTEPPPSDHPLFAAPNCLITPHMAWATQSARQRLLNGSVRNVESFLNGQPSNVVNSLKIK